MTRHPQGRTAVACGIRQSQARVIFVRGARARTPLRPSTFCDETASARLVEEPCRPGSSSFRAAGGSRGERGRGRRRVLRRMFEAPLGVSSRGGRVGRKKPPAHGGGPGRRAVVDGAGGHRVDHQIARAVLQAGLCVAAVSDLARGRLFSKAMRKRHRGQIACWRNLAVRR